MLWYNVYSIDTSNPPPHSPHTLIPKTHVNVLTYLSEMIERATWVLPQYPHTHLPKLHTRTRKQTYIDPNMPTQIIPTHRRKIKTNTVTDTQIEKFVHTSEGATRDTVTDWQALRKQANTAQIHTITHRHTDPQRNLLRYRATKPAPRDIARHFQSEKHSERDRQTNQKHSRNIETYHTQTHIQKKTHSFANCTPFAYKWDFLPVSLSVKLFGYL